MPTTIDIEKLIRWLVENQQFESQLLYPGPLNGGAYVVL